MKRFNNFKSLKKNSRKNLNANQIKPSIELETEKFINLLKSSVINISQFTQSVK
jgi:hypothetical protein